MLLTGMGRTPTAPLCPPRARRFPTNPASPHAPLPPKLLDRYYHTHGCGLVSQHSVLAWTGKLQAQDVLKGAPAAGQPCAGPTWPCCSRRVTFRSTALLDTPHPLSLAGVHELQAAEDQGLVGGHHHAAATLLEALTEHVQRDLSSTSSPLHVAVCGGAADRWLFTGGGRVGFGWGGLGRLPAGPAGPQGLACPACVPPQLRRLTPGMPAAPLPLAAWALQHLEAHQPSADKKAAAAGLRTLVVPSQQLNSMGDLAWSLSAAPTHALCCGGKRRTGQQQRSHAGRHSWHAVRWAACEDWPWWLAHDAPRLPARSLSADATCASRLDPACRL